MKKRKINILLVSYFFAPDKRVGALRTSYWYKELGNNCPCSVEVLTANTEAKGKGIHIVPLIGKTSGFSTIKDDGLVWKKNVRTYITSNALTTPDVVLISGSPFLHFSLAKDFKSIYGCKVILDYRDPFANNPGFKNSKVKIAIKRFFERSFNKHADGLITVNDFCASIIENFDSRPNAIVQNGYDESVVISASKVDLNKLSFSYAGKFYFNPEIIIESLALLNLKLYYAGPDGDKLSNNTNVDSAGFLKYNDAVHLIGQHPVGIIQTYGEDFQSTTKIFEYVRCKRIILIVSNNFLERGSIHEELKGYPNVYWAKNEMRSICNAIEKIKCNPYLEPAPDFDFKFSRKVQIHKLIELIENVLN